MTEQDLSGVLSVIKSTDNPDQAAALLKLASEAIAFQALKDAPQKVDPNSEEEKEFLRIINLPFADNRKTVSTIIKFTKKEVDAMAKTFKKEFFANGMAAKIIKRPSGKNGFYYEIRYRRNGYNITVSNADLKMAKKLFIEFTKHLDSPEFMAKSKLKFSNMANEWLAYKQDKIAENTWKDYGSLIRRCIPDEIKNKLIGDIHTKDIDEVMQELDTPRRYEDMRTVFNGIFKYAKANGNITVNPVDLIPFKRAERENRDRITDEQIISFLTNLKDPFYDRIRNFALAMYFFGLRPCEIDEEARFENGFLICRNRKRRNGKKAYKKIPIPRQAEKFFDFNSPLKSPLSYDRTLDIMEKALGEGVVPYQLRHTFASICDESVKREVVELWMGDSPERLVGKTYVHYSDKFMRAEMDKVCFVIPKE
ncbi:MAG: hypothetical protein NC114_09020 [Ruminococcus flavefaciens]|nr:hypothetical protein [Ruminococcus flavefaciens]